MQIFFLKISIFSSVIFSSVLCGCYVYYTMCREGYVVINWGMAATGVVWTMWVGMVCISITWVGYVVKQVCLILLIFLLCVVAHFIAVAYTWCFKNMIRGSVITSLKINIWKLFIFKWVTVLFLNKLYDYFCNIQKVNWILKIMYIYISSVVWVKSERP